MEGYDFEKLAREIVAGRLSGLSGGAIEAAAEIAKRVLIAALQSTATKQQPAVTVAAVCRGVLGGLMLINQDLPAAAVRLLKELSNVSHETPLPPEDLMNWAMEGFAAVALVGGPETILRMEGAIEESFMGAGVAFRQACERARRQGAA